MPIMNHMKVLVLTGGDSNEREVSLRSGAAVAKALKQAGHQVESLDPRDRPLASELKQNFDVAFPIIHGAGGEDGSLQQQLENIGLPYVGSGVAASKLCFDKWQWRKLVDEHQVKLAEGALVSYEEFKTSPLAKKPFVLKPTTSGSSVDTIIVRDAKNSPVEEINQVFNRHSKLLLEELIEGIEITVGVVGDQALPVIEIIPPQSGEFDYENKYNGASQELCPPKNVPPGIQVKAQELALNIHRLCGCVGLSRTDMIITPSGELLVLETNTLPGMTDASLLPKAAQEAGMDMSHLCDYLVKQAKLQR